METMICAGHTGSVDQALKYNGRRLKDGIEVVGGHIENERWWVLTDRDSGEVLERLRLGQVT